MKERLKQVLSRRCAQHIVDASRVPAAVLLPIYVKQGEYHILFTKRTELVRDHKGQISFPGGVYQEEDRTLVCTALRESNEEIGLKAEDVEILGELDDEASVTTYYIISPFVGFIPCPYQFILNEDEAEELIEVPISALLDRNCLKQEIETIDSSTVTSYFYHYQDRIIWGATARILYKFLGLFSRAMQAK